MRPLEVWGGVECTVNRVGDTFRTQLDKSGHNTRLDDLERFAALGIRAIRYPVLWESTAPHGIDKADWRFADERLPALRQLNVEPIVGLVHHGSGPNHTSLLDGRFADGLAEFAAAVAARFPWVAYWTPVNEPLTTARFSCLYGVWYPHSRCDRAFVAAILNQCRATVLAMRAIRIVNPGAKLVQTDDLSQTYGTDVMVDKVAFYNTRRWLGWDLLCGLVTKRHPLWTYLTDSGASEADLNWFVDNRCPPDILGVNHYITSDRWLDHRVSQFPAQTVGSGDNSFVDIEAVRVMAHPKPGIGTLLDDAWHRYAIPIAVTEAHLDARREDQMRWLLDIWNAAERARRTGADIRAVTVWSLLGAFDWNRLLAADSGYYEPGAFDARFTPPRPTGLAKLASELASGQTPTHTLLRGEGWWRRSDRFVCKPVVARSPVARLSAYRPQGVSRAMRPILVSGANGTLGKAFKTVCVERNIPCELLSRGEMDIADARSVAEAFSRWRPWAVVNASGYGRIDQAESQAELCFRENAHGPATLARQCAKSDVGLLTFSSDQVFDGHKDRPWLESDKPKPLNCYGRSQAVAEREVLSAWPRAMVIRAGPFFSPWDQRNFLSRALEAAQLGQRFLAASDVRVSPTYLPDLVNVALDLLVDDESGMWHLANVGDVTWVDFARLACDAAGVDAASIVGCRSADVTIAPRPLNSVLGSARAVLLPNLAGAVAHFAQCRADAAARLGSNSLVRATTLKEHP